MDILKGTGYFKIDYKSDDKPATGMRGAARFRLPRSVDSVDIERVSLGYEVSGAGYTLKVLELGAGSAVLSVTGDREKIVGFKVYNEEGKEITLGSPAIERVEGRWMAKVSYGGVARRMEMVYAKKQDVVAYPIVLMIVKQ